MRCCAIHAPLLSNNTLRVRRSLLHAPKISLLNDAVADFANDATFAHLCASCLPVATEHVLLINGIVGNAVRLYRSLCPLPTSLLTSHSFPSSQVSGRDADSSMRKHNDVAWEKNRTHASRSAYLLFHQPNLYSMSCPPRYFVLHLMNITSTNKELPPKSPIPTTFMQPSNVHSVFLHMWQCSRPRLHAIDLQVIHIYPNYFTSGLQETNITFFVTDNDDTRIEPDSGLVEWITNLQEQKLQKLQFLVAEKDDEATFVFTLCRSLV